MRMPEMDGLDLLAEMRQRGNKTPTVIITAYGDIPHAVRAMSDHRADKEQLHVVRKEVKAATATS